MEVTYEKKSEKISASLIYNLTDIHHLHKEIEIIYVKKGKAVAFADNNRLMLESGDLFISFPNQIHFYDNIVSDAQYLLIIASMDILPGMKNILRNNIPVSNKINISGNKTALELIEKMSYMPKTEYRITALAGCFCLLMCEILPMLTLCPSTNTDNSTLRNILDYCNEHFTEHITLDDAAEALHMSKYYISRLMNEKIKFGFNDYINSLRINYACDLLADTETKISDISESVGFGTIRSFNRVFQSSKNLTPLEYRKIYSKKQRAIQSQTPI